jgi:Bacterial Ig-like domain (group 3)/Divergent InlB B-repeat domain
MSRFHQNLFALTLATLSFLGPLASRLAAQDHVFIQGTVTDRTSGAPIQGVSVSAGSSPVLTDANGNYSLTGEQVAQQTGVVYFTNAHGYFNYSTRYDLTQGTPSTINATLLYGGTIVQGVVADSSTQAPISGASVSVGVYGGSGYATTGAGGTYALDASAGFAESALNGFTIDYLQANAPGYLSFQEYVNIAVTPPLPYAQNFQLIPNGVGYLFTVTTAPSGLNVIVDGTTYVAPHLFTWPANSVHTLGVASPQGSAGTQYVYNSWSDGGAATHTITAPAANSSYTASFATQYLLTTGANPSNGGSVTPASGSYYPASAQVNLTATPSSGYNFSNWTGNVANPSSASTTVFMSAPETVTANFGHNASPTTTALTSSLNPSKFGQSVIFTATVTPTAGGTPTGNVTFADGVNVLGVVALNGGQAMLTTSLLGAGSHSLVASYGGDIAHQSSASTALTQSVGVANSTLTVTSNLDPSVYNQAVTFTAMLTPQFGGTATGTVTLLSGGNPLGTALVSGNQAALTLNTLAIGTSVISATYNGDSNISGSTSHGLNQTVKKASTAAVVTSSLNPAFVGQTITYTATVGSQYQGAVSGTVNFKSGSVSLGSATLVNGQASLTTSYSAHGSYSVIAMYGGDSNNKASTSPALKQVVNDYTSAVSLVSSLNPSIVGQTVTFTATVTSGATGSVTFKSGAIILGLVPLTGNTASVATSSLTAGSHNITAVYGGDLVFKGSTSPALKQVVTTH